jgi:superfamily II DNA or RNA helicase
VAERREALGLRPYQNHAVAKVVHAFHEHQAQWPMPQPWVLCGLPTGSGKTLVGLVAASRYVGDGRVLWLARQKELLHRARKEVQHAKASGLVPKGVRFDFETIQRVDVGNYNIKGKTELVVFDEAHHLHGHQSWIRTLQRLGWPVLGLTATPRRTYEEDGWVLAEYISRDELTPSYLASPVPIVCRTGVRPRHVGLRMLGAVVPRVTVS